MLGRLGRLLLGLVQNQTVNFSNFFEKTAKE